MRLNAVGEKQNLSAQKVYFSTVGTLVMYICGCIYIYIYAYVWQLNQRVLELDLWADTCLFFLRRDLNSQHWYAAVPITYHYVQRPRPLGHTRYAFTWFMTGFLTGITQHVLLVQQELRIHLVHIHRSFEWGLLCTIFHGWISLTYKYIPLLVLAY